MTKVTREKDFSVSTEAIYKAITDFQSYPEFLPEVVSAEILPGATAEKAQVKFELEVVKRFEYVLSFSMKPGKEVVWSLKESNFFKSNSGLWRLKSTGAKTTHVEYEVEVGFGFLVPKFVVKKLTEGSLPKMFDNFESRARAL